MKLHCPKCNRVTLELSSEEQGRILSEMNGPADSHIEECPVCHIWQWSLTARVQLSSS